MDATKIENSDIQNEDWNEKRLARNARKRERREKQKLENPDCRKMECKEWREKQKNENPEYTKMESQKRKERREKQQNSDQDKFKKCQIFADIYDILFDENKDSFIIPVSKNEWRILKENELSFIFNEKIFPEGNTIQDIRNSQKENIIFLREHPFHQLGPSIIFFLKTMVHRPKENTKRKITKEEMDWVFSLDLNDYDKSPKKSRNYAEDKKQRNKDYHEKVVSDRKTHNLNIRFMKEDPNRVLSVDDITINPFVSNYCAREEYKINLWKHDKNPEFLEKWKKQRMEYEKTVLDLSIEYKENFLKNKWLAQF